MKLLPKETLYDYSTQRLSKILEITDCNLANGTSALI